MINYIYIDSSREHTSGFKRFYRRKLWILSITHLTFMNMLGGHCIRKLLGYLLENFGYMDIYSKNNILGYEWIWYIYNMKKINAFYHTKSKNWGVVSEHGPTSRHSDFQAWSAIGRRGPAGGWHFVFEVTCCPLETAELGCSPEVWQNLLGMPQTTPGNVHDIYIYIIAIQISKDLKGSQRYSWPRTC